MFNLYCYPFLVLLSLIFVSIGVYLALRYAPKKVKVISVLLFSLLALRYIILVLFIVSKNIILLYLLKPGYYLNFLCIPILAFISLFIVIRSEKIKINNIIKIFIFFSFVYVVLLFLLSCNIQLSSYYGYTMLLIKYETIDIFYISLNFVFMLLGIKLIEKKNIDLTGIYLIIISSLITIVEISIPLRNQGLFQENILGELFWIITVTYSLNKLKGRN